MGMVSVVVFALLPPPVRAATVRLPRTTSDASGTSSVERMYRVVVATAAAAVLWLRVVSDTAMLDPGAAAMGADSAEITRSGKRMATVRTVMLSASFASAIAPSSSARAITEYVPAARPGGNGTVIDPTLLAYAPSDPTLRLPRTVAVASSVETAER